jgi:hypothetical protein
MPWPLCRCMPAGPHPRDAFLPLVAPVQHSRELGCGLDIWSKGVSRWVVGLLVLADVLLCSGTWEPAAPQQLGDNRDVLAQLCRGAPAGCPSAAMLDGMQRSRLVQSSTVQQRLGSRVAGATCRCLQPGHGGEMPQVGSR